ncbi:MAG: ABC transporter substrate-binding protein [Acutalibacter sp.]|nr:ABC transporter substrate-binding protein [Acutalibacter sp.]
MSKRIISLLIVLVLVVGMFAGCGTGSNSGSTPNKDNDGNAETGKIDGEGYTVNYLYMVAQEGANQQKVAEAIDALAMEELNMHVNLIPMTFGTYMSQLAPMLAANEPLDIFPAMSSSFATYIESQYVVNLADYLDYFGDTLEVFGDDAYCGYIGDFLVGFSQMKERGYPTGMVVRKDLMEEAGFSVEDFNVTTDDYSTFEQIDELFAKVKELHPEIICLDGTTIMAAGAGSSYVDNMGDDFGVLENYGQATKVTNYFESDQFRTLCDIAKRWFDAGYVSQDIVVNQDSGETKMRAGNCLSFVCYVKPNTNVEKLAQTSYETEVISLGNAMKSTNAVNAVMFSMANAAKDKTKAAQFMNWTFTSQKFNDLINWGIEGEDWVLDDQGLAAYPDGVDATSVGYHNDFGWIYPNQFAGHPWTGNPTDIWDQYRTYNGAMEKSKAFGFTFNSTPVANEEATLVSVSDQYLKSLAFGAVDDLDASIAEFNNALYGAGLQKVMDEKQKQLDEFLANNG